MLAIGLTIGITAMNYGTERAHSAPHHRRLEQFRSMYHREVAVAAALDLCNEYDLPVPAWLRKEALEILCSSLKRERSTNRGRSNGALARYRQDMVDLERHAAVDGVRYTQQRLQETARNIQGNKDCEEFWNRYEKEQQAWLGYTLDQAFACASAQLADTDSFGGKAAIKASYLRVQRGNDRAPYRYVVLEYSILEKLDLAVLGAPKRDRVRKLSELYDLTPP